MPKSHSSNLDGTALRVGVVCSRFNSLVTERLLAGALDGLRECKVADDAIEVAHVPGAFEIPLVAEQMATAERTDAVVAVGAVIRGETAHFDFIADWVVAEIGRIMVAQRVPIALGILTTNSVEQGLERSGGRHGNKGYESAQTAVEMANLMRSLRVVE
jgi:6,7-dimethyl-8-ribityllumazine synthase